MDKEMYFHMMAEDPDPIIDRGMALHKIIRLLTASIGGEGYLNFMGNEFGHPEWIDFPREGNDWSYQHARRQWSLADRKELKYQYLQAFDSAMIDLLKEGQVLPALAAKQLNVDEENMVLIYERNHLIFVINLHPDRSIPDYGCPVPEAGKYELILNTDDAAFGGHGRVAAGVNYFTQPDEHKTPILKFYTTSRTALVFRRVEEK
jgi:1,4-alpha-glucan branching enzyme